MNIVFCSQVVSQEQQISVIRSLIDLIISSDGPLWRDLVGATQYKGKSQYTQMFNINLHSGELTGTVKFYENKKKLPLPKFIKKFRMKGREGDVIPVFPSMKDSLRSILTMAHSLNERVPCPNLYIPGMCECIMYDTQGYVEGHCDCINGWVVVISLGLSANFWYFDKEKKSKVTLHVKSGDAVVFNGSAALNICHGVDSIVAGSLPYFLKNEIPEAYYDKRLILQIRQELGAHPFLKNNK